MSPSGVRSEGGKRRMVYLQYTNPAGYPPLEHSSRMLADAGWDVLFLGAAADGANGLAFPPHPGISVHRFGGYGKGLAQRLNYMAFLAWATARCLSFKPAWVYASEALSCPAALAVRRSVGCRVLYHEHDSPIYREPLTRAQRFVRDARTRIARSADICVLPQQRRLQDFVEETGRKGPTLCVWNCPRSSDVGPERAPARPGDAVTFHYHGSLNRERLPQTILQALNGAGENARLRIVGYETVGSKGYMQDFLAQAEALGLGRRIDYLGALPKRADMLAAAARSDVGLSFMPPGTDDKNMTHMTGASNKPFDYLAVGQALLVSELPDWRAMYVEPGYGRACDAYDAASLGQAMRWYVEHPAEARAMGEAGRRRILSEWNYERCFGPVADRLAHAASKVQA
jgi:glycosyltransferase involved in cell wall biosynthesis